MQHLDGTEKRKRREEKEKEKEKAIHGVNMTISRRCIEVFKSSTLLVINIRHTKYSIKNEITDVT